MQCVAVEEVYWPTGALGPGVVVVRAARERAPSDGGQTMHGRTIAAELSSAQLDHGDRGPTVADDACVRAHRPAVQRPATAGYLAELAKRPVRSWKTPCRVELELAAPCMVVVANWPLAPYS